MPDADLDRIIAELRRKREQLTDVIERLLVTRDEPAGEQAVREEPPKRE